MNSYSKKIASVLLSISVALLSLSTFAVPPYKPNLVDDGNRWLITFYNDSATSHTRWATQGLCFFKVADIGTHSRYVWYSDTFPNWNGRATQEGDQIIMHGDYANAVGHDGMQWNIVTDSPKNEGSGHWSEWREDSGYGRTIGWGNAKFQRVGKCSFAIDDSKELIPEEYAWELARKYYDIPYPHSVNKQEIVIPSGDGLTNDVDSVWEAR